jgi:hypothetical protein
VDRAPSPFKSKQISRQTTSVPSSLPSTRIPFNSAKLTSPNPTARPPRSGIPPSARPISSLSTSSAHRREPAYIPGDILESPQERRRRKRDSRGFNSARSASGFEELLKGTDTIRMSGLSSGSSTGSVDEEDKSEEEEERAVIAEEKEEVMTEDDFERFKKASRPVASGIEDELAERSEEEAAAYEEEGRKSGSIGSRSAIVRSPPTSPSTRSPSATSPSSPHYNPSASGSRTPHRSSPKPPSSFQRTSSTNSLHPSSPRPDQSKHTNAGGHSRTTSNDTSTSLTPRIRQTSAFDDEPSSSAQPGIIPPSPSGVHPTPDHPPPIVTQHQGIEFPLGQPIASSSSSQAGAGTTPGREKRNSFFRPGGTAESPDVATVVRKQKEARAAAAATAALQSLAPSKSSCGSTHAPVRTPSLERPPPLPEKDRKRSVGESDWLGIGNSPRPATMGRKNSSSGSGNGSGPIQDRAMVRPFS